MVQLRGIDGLFLHVYLAVYRYKPRDLALSVRGCIRNSDVVRVIKEAYRNYQTSGQDIENYYNIQIVNFEAPRYDRSYIATCDNVSRKPIVICSTKDRNKKVYTYGIQLSELKINKPIKMSLKHIFSIYGILTQFDDTNVQGMFRLEDMHSINIHLYELDDEDRGYLHSGLPGTRECYNRDVYIGKRAENYFWITKNLVKKRFRCTKLPGKCIYYTYDESNLHRHMATCTDQTTITATQVLHSIKKSNDSLMLMLISYFRKYMVNQKIRFLIW